jgi:hypothetical protein
MDSLRRFGGILCIVLVAIGLFAAPAAAVDEPANGQFIVELDANGDADVVFTDEFDLTDPQQRPVFEEVRENEEFERQAKERFREGIRSVSEQANEEIDRELRVGEVTIGTVVDGETGYVVYRFRWENLAVVDEDRIVLSEPFSTYDTLDRELIVLAPEGGELTSVSPQPARRGEDVASWPGLTAFGDNFEVVATVPDESDEFWADSTPEFASGSETYGGGGPVVLGVSLLLFVTLFVGRQR